MKSHLLGAVSTDVFTLVISAYASAALVDRGGNLVSDTDLAVRGTDLSITLAGA
jgi:hypothetical protein